MDGLCFMKMMLNINHFSWKWSVEECRVRSWLAKFSIIYAGKYSNDIIDNVKDGDKSSQPPPPANDCLQLKHREICSSALFRIPSWAKTDNKKLQDIAQRRTEIHLHIFAIYSRISSLATSPCKFSTSSDPGQCAATRQSCWNCRSLQKLWSSGRYLHK